MAAALVVPVSGPYTATWGANPLGTQGDDGFALSVTFQGQEVNLSDAYGMTLVEVINRGLNWRLRFRSLEVNKSGFLSALQAFGQTGANTTLTPTLQNIGDRYSKFAAAMLLTSIIGAYPPTMPTTLTATNAIVAPQSSVEQLMTSKMREGPFEMVLLPYASGGSPSFNIPFSTTG
jgi:hypothetical protein